METQKTLFEQMITFFLSAFRFPGLSWKPILIAVALGLVFGAIWLAAYWPRVNNKRWHTMMFIVSAFLTWVAIAFIQVPLQNWIGQALLHFWNQFTILKWLLLAGIPSILLSGLVQEGAKMVPVVFFWLSKNRRVSVKMGLIAGAIAGAGFGIFEAVWVHNSMFQAGWTWQTVQTNGYLALIGFQERFFTVGFHIAVSALAGYGLARGLGWQFYLLASVLHGAVNYIVLPMQKGILNTYEVEIYIAVFTIALTGVVLWLRWKKTLGPTDESEQEADASP
jgi:RsiW-degrading membrane proteinase PrsW (M82 family)